MKTRKEIFEWLSRKSAERMAVMVMVANESLPMHKMLGYMDAVKVDYGEWQSITCYVRFHAPLRDFVCADHPNLTTDEFLLTLGVAFPDLPSCTSVEGRMHALVDGCQIDITELNYDQRRGKFVELPYTIFIDADPERVLRRFETFA